MEIGKEKPAIIVEPVKDPFPSEPVPAEPAVEPSPTPEAEPVEATA
jgi:hypothetical protein